MKQFRDMGFWERSAWDYSYANRENLWSSMLNMEAQNYRHGSYVHGSTLNAFPIIMCSHIGDRTVTFSAALVVTLLAIIRSASHGLSHLLLTNLQMDLTVYRIS